ncbi:hypothetical protein ACFOLC_07090 [Lysobacter cavernae]|uniref:Rhodanese domain-containing protein n=1 Tax=Lysobacter cavernae TaxID=1685901 RepID=A0ABV7RRE9_9GAMM
MPLSVFDRARRAGLMLALMAAAPAFAQDVSWAQWGIDPSVLAADGRDLLRRAPDASIDGLFQAVHASAQSPQDARVLCTLFDPQAERSIAGYNAIAAQLGEASRTHFATAVADLVIAAAQSPRQPFDAATAQQALKAAGVRAALLDDGFVAGLNGGDHDARCRSVGALLDAVQARPLAERAAVTRLLLSEGLNYLAAANAGPGTR